MENFRPRSTYSVKIFHVTWSYHVVLIKLLNASKLYNKVFSSSTFKRLITEQRRSTQVNRINTLNVQTKTTFILQLL